MPATLVYALVKESTGERYVFLLDETEESRKAFLSTICRFAMDPELSFGWHDAAMMGKKVGGTFRIEEKPR